MNLSSVLAMLEIINRLEPIAAQAILAFIQKLDGKSTDEILAEADAIWDEVKAEARKEQGFTDQA